MKINRHFWDETDGLLRTVDWRFLENKHLYLNYYFQVHKFTEIAEMLLHRFEENMK